MVASRPIARVLVANRSEIARRIIRTCTRLGIESVAVYTDVDAHAPFVTEATAALALGAPESYLSIEKVIAAAKESRADAVHPGYGFLSENPAFAAACEAAGITLLGPSSETMRTLGSKTSAKQVAQSANVPTAPTLIFSQDPLLPRADQLKAFAERVGYPVMLKAAAGGGGRGMRLVTGPEGMAQQIESAERESLKAFGSDEIFAERCITPARHIEVQVVADSHGGVVALGTRDCTLQRSNQKIIEEGPATGLAPGAELELCEAACRLAKAARYRSLGTVEFLYASDGSFYFLEVNTRLQVEHPVTEMVTGLDLVEAQIRIAEGKRLTDLGIQGTPKQQGHAIEARLCAEELRAGSFVLSAGIVQEFEVPTRSFDAAQVRVDSGVEPCSEVTHYYDSLIAKVIVRAPSRDEAIKALHECLSRARISGVQTNRGLLLHLLAHPIFAAQSHTIQGTAALLPSESDQLREAVIAHAVVAALRCSTGRSLWAARSPWLTVAPASSKISFPWLTASSGHTISSSTTATDEGANVIISVGGADTSLTVSLDDIAPAQPSGTALRATVGPDTREVRATIVRDGAYTWVHLRSGSVCLEERTALPATRSGSGAHIAREVTAHIPGKVAALSVAVGEQVSAGQVLLVLDSMKMEHPIKSPVAGKVTALPQKAGAIVQTGAVLATLEDG